ncbi:nucleotidyl transferase AbiEii/AbiGii toxin family protein [Roseivirga thermotolerans]|uniref:nucleotidyl transferase AbiEii/AbiGii toxin family protein n=1 Tax=Roseivirga thermotolerans TaxID=1758176 RepID=UPI00273D1BF9|nr:nucleotidyl transferase AbiEii/AbiGii toxin family protein [Roseivirga thermotolerans]
MRDQYKRQVDLLLQVLPEVAKEDCFALHGGTAINLFVREMPRLSVDIDLTYIPIEDRQTSLENISTALIRIKGNVEKAIPNAFIIHQSADSKLQISNQGAQIKIEVNSINRGVLNTPEKRILCDRAQEEFDAFCEVPVVPFSQLYGGKICAALDRQHPRDIFDIKLLLENEGLTEEIKPGLILTILSSKRPIHELLNPNLLDQRAAMANQFEGMTAELFPYNQYESTRQKLIGAIQQILDDRDKQFLLGFSKGEPDWSIYNFEQFPSVQWKLQNLIRLKEDIPKKHQEQHNALLSLWP